MLAPECIYCRASGDSVVFSREHVLQVSFGAFRDAPVLHDCVCHDCNQFFGKSLDLALARQSFEGLQRYRWGVKNPEEVSKFKYSATDLRADVLGDYSGAWLELAGGSDGVRVRPAPGAAIRNATGDDFSNFTVEQILSGAWKASPVDWRRGIKLFGDDALTDRMRAALTEQGVAARSWRPLVPPETDGPISVTHSITITSEMRRAIAKVAFNYLAHVAGPTLCLAPAFDTLREYVRFGRIPSLDPVHSDDTLPFATKRDDGGRPVVHWLGLSSHESHSNLLGSVMLFGSLNHTIVLAEGFTAHQLDLPIAQIYSLKTMQSRNMPRRRR